MQVFTKSLRQKSAVSLCLEYDPPIWMGTKKSLLPSPGSGDHFWGEGESLMPGFSDSVEHGCFYCGFCEWFADLASV